MVCFVGSSNFILIFELSLNNYKNEKCKEIIFWGGIFFIFMIKVILFNLYKVAKLWGRERFSREKYLEGKGLRRCWLVSCFFVSWVFWFLVIRMLVGGGIVMIG